MWFIPLLVSSAAFAHRPSYGNDFNSFECAYEVEDPDVSIVLYAEMTCEHEYLWMHLETEDREQIWVELGMPQLDRLEDWRPALAVVGPGMPDVELPFDLPEGMGATVYETGDVEEPTFFYEEFTSTASWVLYSGWVDVPPDSDIYLVAWDPNQVTGKLWVAVGLVEDFSESTVEDFVYWMDATQAFHEVDGDIKDTEESCATVEDSLNTSNTESGIGCNQAASAHISLSQWSAVWLGFLVCGPRRSNEQVKERFGIPYLHQNLVTLGARGAQAQLVGGANAAYPSGNQTLEPFR